MGVVKTYKNIVDDVSVRLKISNAAEKESVKTWVNIAYRDFQIRSNFYWRKRQDTLQVIPFYKTGTVAVTLDSRTIIGTNTVWISSMEGRYIQFGGENSFYRIAKVVGNTEITLDQPYTDDTASGLSYKICKRFYNLISDVDEVLQFYSDYSSEPIMAQSFLPNFYEGEPTFFQKVGIDPKIIQYTTGTVSGSINTRTITGVGTSWIANVQKGDLFTPVGGSTYNVLSVDSDTQLTLVQNLLVAVTALDTYIIQRQDLTQIEFNSTPTETTQMQYDYLKKTFDMMNDNDEPEIPLQYRDVLILGSIVIAYQYLSLEGGELKQQFASSMYEKRINEIKDKVENEKNMPSGWYW